ncbi:hypothetical protein, partial [Niveispirillum fermenti]|uniref:hypothetical protein n=1 Tax=Niveispirillum fermenti TaxID=1233113 RepID=UPI003A86AD35
MSNYSGFNFVTEESYNPTVVDVIEYNVNINELNNLVRNKYSFHKSVDIALVSIRMSLFIIRYEIVYSIDDIEIKFGDGASI